MPDPRFTDRLLAADPPTPTARGRYDQKVRAMFETVIGPRRRGLSLLCAVALAGLASVHIFLVRPPADQPMTGDEAEFGRVVRVFALTTAAALLTTAVLFGLLWWTGVEDRRATARWVTRIGVCYIGAVAWFVLGLARLLPEPMRDELRVAGELVALGAVGVWVRGRVARAEEATTERLLELELRLAEIQEAVRGGSAAGA